MTRPSSLADLATIFDSQPISGMRNRIINGDMRIDQRNAGGSFSSGIGTVTFGLDRFYVFSASAAVTVQRVNPNLMGFSNALRVTGASGVTYTEVGQRIESANIADLAGSTVVLSFWAAASVATSLSVYSNFANSQDNFLNSTGIASTAITINSALTRYSFSFTLPSQAANGIIIGFFFPTGLTSGSSTFTLTGIQLEAGPFASPFERRPFGQELKLCERYFEKSYNLDMVPGTADMSHLFTTTPDGFSLQPGIWFMTEKRAVPTVTLYSTTGAAGQVRRWNDLNQAAGAGHLHTKGFLAQASGMTVGAFYAFHWAASAEL